MEVGGGLCPSLNYNESLERELFPKGAVIQKPTNQPTNRKKGIWMLAR
jgi:hypothetical protein